MSNNKYIIKSLAPWMMDELIAFSKITDYDIIFLRKQNDFYEGGIQELKDNGIRVYNTPYSFGKLFYKLLIVFTFFLSNISKFRIDYNSVISFKSLWWFIKLDLSIFSNDSNIHAQFATQASITSLLIKNYFNNKPTFSFSFHAYDIYFNNRWFSLLVENCNNAFSISDFNINYVKKQYLYSNKITLSRLGVFRETDVNALFNKTENKTFTLGIISWFVEKKGINYLLHAFLELKHLGYANIKLILAGDGPLRSEYIDFIESNQLTNSIEYIGKINGPEKKHFFKSLDAFILPSISLKNDQDGIPVVLMEAISYGLPIISTNVSGIPEICINDYNGYLIGEKNVNEIINAIISLYDKRANKVQFSKNSLALSEKYDIVLNSQNKVKNLSWQ